MSEHSKRPRKFVVAANWKMNKSPAEAAEYFKNFQPKFSSSAASKNQDLTVVFFVPAIDLTTVAAVLKPSTIGWGAQNSYFEMNGAFTGENSPKVLSEIGAPYTLVGHSERRAIFKESDDDAGKKVKALQAVGITPMLCVGESLSEREGNQTNDVILRQLKAGLALRDPAKPVIIAYEPVWAIGTGKVATPEQANDAHAVLRKGLEAIGGPELASATPILYGGSVKPDNANQIAGQKDVDGFLVGGASLEVDSFLSLCQTVKKQVNA